MKRRGKGFKTLVFTTVMGIVAVSAGCSDTQKTEQTSQPSSTVSTAPSASTAPKEKVTLRVEIFDRGNAPSGLTVTDNALTRYIQKTFGDPNNIKMEFVPVPRGQEVDKLNVLMASSDAPDIVFTYNESVARKYMAQGGLTDLTSLVNQYGPNLKTYLGDKTLAYGKWEDKQLAIPAKRVFTGLTTWEMRKDWLDKLGVSAPQTTQQTHDVLKAFKDKQLGGQGTIPLGLALHPDEYIPLVLGLIKNPTEEQYYTGMQRLSLQEYPILMDGHKEALKTINQWYSEGLISPDFGLDKDENARKQGVATGKIGLYSEQSGQSFENGADGQAGTLAKNVPGGTLIPVDPISNDQGKHVKELNPATGMYLMVPKTSKVAAQAVQYLNWLAQINNLLYYILGGPEGTAYQMQNGIPVLIKRDVKPEDLIFNGGDMAIVTNGLDFGTGQTNIKFMAQNFLPEYIPSAIESYRLSSEVDAVPIHTFPKPIDSEAKFGQVLKGKYEELFVKSVLAKPSDFDKTYDDLLKQYMTSGGVEIQKERVAAYQSMKK